MAGLRVQLVGAHVTDGFAAPIRRFARRVEAALVRVQRQEARAGRLGGQFRRAQPARGRVQASDVDALALRAGVGADIDPHRAGGSNALCEHSGMVNQPARYYSPNQAEWERQFHGPKEHNCQPYSMRKACRNKLLPASLLRCKVKVFLLASGKGRSVRQRLCISA